MGEEHCEGYFGADFGRCISRGGLQAFDQARMTPMVYLLNPSGLSLVFHGL
jgi:hypothetical protein